MNRVWMILGLLYFFDVQAAEYSDVLATKNPLEGMKRCVQAGPNKMCLVDAAGNELRCRVFTPAEIKAREKALKRLREEQQRLREHQRGRDSPGPYQNPPALWPAPYGRHAL